MFDDDSPGTAAGTLYLDEDVGVADDEFISTLMNDFNNWKTLILAVEQKAGEIVFAFPQPSADRCDTGEEDTNNEEE